MKPRPLRDRFFEKIAICEHGSTCENCHWPWLAGKKHGHGKFYLRSEGPRKKKRKVEIRAELLMWIIAYGTIPRRGHITQTCGQGDCMNFHHLTPTIFHTNALRTAYVMEGVHA